MERRSFLLAGAALGAASPLFYPDAALAVPNVRSAIVQVKVFGVRPNSEDAGSVQGTGVFVSLNGYVVTSRHLITKLGEVQANLTRFEIQTENFTTPIPAYKLFEDAASDLMVLYAPMGNRPFTSLRVARRARQTIRPAETVIYTAGFPAGLGYIMAPGHVISFEGPVTPALPFWTTNLTFKEGQSGSPIIMADGSLAAIAKGVDLDATQIGFIVPALLVPDNYCDESSYAPANLDEASATPQLVVTTTQPQARAVPITIEDAACAGAPTRRWTIQARAGWRVTATPAVVQHYQIQGAGIITSIVEQTEDRVVVEAQLDLSACTGAPRFSGAVVFAEVPRAAAGAEVTRSALLPGATIPVGTADMNAISATVQKEDGTTQQIRLERGDFRRVGRGVAIDASRVLARAAM